MTALLTILQIATTAPKAEVADPRSVWELLVQLVGAIALIYGGSIAVRFLIYKQFGDDYPISDFRRGMLRGALWFLGGLALIIAAMVVGARYR
jgi:hypothetical protein